MTKSPSTGAGYSPPDCAQADDEFDRNNAATRVRTTPVVTLMSASCAVLYCQRPSMNIAYRPRIGLAAAVVAAAALLASPAAQSPRRMSMVDVINVPRVNDAQLSPDGNIAVYVLNVADWKVDRKVSHIWRQDID